MSWWIFDIESIPDDDLLIRVERDDLSLPDVTDEDKPDIVNVFKEERVESGKTDFIPYTLQVPACIGIIKLDDGLEFEGFRFFQSHELGLEDTTRGFWQEWEDDNNPTFVTFNGRSFDLPMLELCAMRYGVNCETWFGGNRPWDKPRNRYNTHGHIDLQEVMTNYGSSRLYGGLNLCSKLIGMPGKMSMDGSQVESMYREGKHELIKEYCRCDIIDTYMLFLRVIRMAGDITEDAETGYRRKMFSILGRDYQENEVVKEYLNSIDEGVKEKCRKFRPS